VANVKHNVQIKFNTNNEELKRSEAELRKINREISKIEKGPIANTDAKRLSDLKQRYQIVQSSIVAARKEQERLTKEINNTTQATQKLTKEQKIQDSLRKYNTGTQDRRNTIGMRTQRALGQSFLEAPLYSLSFAAMAGLASTVQQFIQLDKVMTRIGIVTDRSAQSMEIFARYANDAGKALGVTGKAFADASLTFLQQGGLAADYAQSLAASSIQLSNITGANASDTAEYITAIANSFKILESDGSRAGQRIADMLASLDAASGSSADEIASAFKRSASSFAAAGFSAEEAAAMIATVSETTRQSAEMVGTGFKTLIGNLAEVKYSAEDFGNITNQLQKVAQQFNLTFELIDRNTGQMKSVPVMLEEIAVLYNSTSDVAAKNALIEAVAGKEQRDRFIALITNQDRYNQLLQEAESSSGAAERANARYLDSIGAKIEQLSNEWENFTLNIIETKAFKDLLDTTTALISNLNNMIESGYGFARVVALIANNLAPITAMSLLGGSSLAGAIGTKITGIGGITGADQSIAQRQRIGVGRGGGFLGQLLGGGAAAVLPSGLADRRTELLGKQTLTDIEEGELSSINKQALRGQAGRAAIGVGVGSFAALGQILNVATQQNLTNMEKFTGSMAALAPAIGSAFGPIGTLVGSLVGLGIQFVSVDKNAAAFREELSRLNTTANESISTSLKQIEELLDTVSDSNIDKTTQAYRDAANRLAELLPALSLGQDEYGNAILDTTEAMKEYIELKKEELQLEKDILALQIQGKITAAQEIGPETSVGFIDRMRSFGSILGQGFLPGIFEYKAAQEYLSPEEKKLDEIKRRQYDAQITRMTKQAVEGVISTEKRGETLELSTGESFNIESAQQAGFRSLVEKNEAVKKAFESLKYIVDETERTDATEAFYKQFSYLFLTTGMDIMRARKPGEVDNDQVDTETDADLLAKQRMDALKSISDAYQIQQKILENTIDAHEQIIEKASLEADIQDRINNSTDETYKTNLKQLQLKIRDATLTRQSIDQYKLQIGLLEGLSSRTQTQMVLQRSSGGGFRFARQIGQETDKSKAITAAAEYESKTVSSYSDLVNQIYTLDQQIAQVESEGGDSSRLKSLRSSLISQRDALKPEIEKAKTISALAAKGNVGLAAQLTAGSISLSQAQGALSAQEIKNIKESSLNATAGVISSQNALIQSNTLLGNSIEELTDKIKVNPNASGILPPGVTAANLNIQPNSTANSQAQNPTNITINNLNLPGIVDSYAFMTWTQGLSNNASQYASSTKSYP
jgi:TP901 family phage tail tape measure protein